MNFLNFFNSKKLNTAKIAKNRLRILIDSKRNKKNKSFPSFLRKKLITKICQHYKVEPNMISIKIRKNNKSSSFLVCKIEIFKK
ncbi:cell division topological specificity factor MinE [bacterium endosymbiont of Pedicinus badii]|uniref:cell division topological specificity factor MinE n=1 Tax=bacterium endosymbiont of Pedicinus badii TaxID=1719126 RepID=UPI00117BE890|nr:cell division topological specificity factor MinE [bacterium endosymbiont of Pedicinus badii]